MRISRASLSSLRSDAIATASRPDESPGKTALRVIACLAERLTPEAPTQQEALLNVLKSASKAERPSRLRWTLGGITSIAVMLVVAFMGLSTTRDDDRPTTTVPERIGDAKHPTSLGTSGDLSAWAEAACGRPGGDFATLAPKTVTGNLESGSDLRLSSPFDEVNDRTASFLLMSPSNGVARFCFAIVRGATPEEVDWYVEEFPISEVQEVVLVRPRGLGYFVVYGGEGKKPFSGQETKLKCPEALVAAQTVTNISVNGTGFWQAACSVAPSPEKGSMTVAAGADSVTYAVEEFVEVPILQTITVQS